MTPYTRCLNLDYSAELVTRPITNPKRRMYRRGQFKPQLLSCDIYLRCLSNVRQLTVVRHAPAKRVKCGHARSLNLDGR
ncbi:hypothetical protein EVAR_97123_1 [Eumeta japonica]|uniref:Uncharacterized protein n=1 Tax=Eumeta variegata TaxID=151549 RepID=A0A4C1WS24_EUMVA|nr:hypothetical protein EVAR_97123_1 [Eumeta japonica]